MPFFFFLNPDAKNRVRSRYKACWRWIWSTVDFFSIFGLLKVMRRVVTLEAHGFDASEYVWKFAKEAYGSIFQKVHFFSHSRASCQSPNALCMILLVKMKAVWASPGFGFWGISKNPTVRFASKLNQWFLWPLRSHSWSLGVCFQFYQEKMLPKSCPSSSSWILMPKMLSVEALVRLVDSQFGQQLTFLHFCFFKVMGRVITLKLHGFDASSDVWKFAKDAYGSIF